VQEVLARVLHAVVRLVPERHVRPALEVLPRVMLPNAQVSRSTAIVPRESQASASRMGSAVSVRVVRLVRVRVVRVVRVMVRVVGPPDAMTGLLASVKSVSSVR
jgi:hypothetical protein